MNGASAGSSRHVTGAGGTRLHYRSWEAESPRAAVLVLHGLFEHSRRYRELAGVLGDAGISTFALDLRGHGASQGRRGYVRRFELFLEDVDRFTADVRRELTDGLPRFLLAHSMGGLVGIRWLEERDPELAGAVITSPWLALADPPAPWLEALVRTLSRVLPIVLIPAGLDAGDLSHDPERVADYRQDPAIYSTVTPRLLTEALDAGREAFRRKARLDLPLLFILAGDDRVVATERATALAGSLDGDVTVDVRPGYYHEVLQETERAAVMAEIVEWIEARLS
ncbi:MAG: lysophospholipase [Candidatus Longimicrobiales bacterium M2_2A_002]